MAAGDVSPYVGSTDVTLMHSVVDVAGLNRVSLQIYSNAAAAIAGMVKAAQPEATHEKPLVAASMFGNTTPCIDRGAGYPRSRRLGGTGFSRDGKRRQNDAAPRIGRIPRRHARSDTTELADEVCGGVFTAGPERVNIAAATAIPVVLAPGCVDMCNFGSPASVPARYGSRLLYEWNSNVTLMRTSVEENRVIGRLLAETANRCAGPVVVLLPLQGVSMLDSPGGAFWDPDADHACFDALRSSLNQAYR